MADNVQDARSTEFGDVNLLLVEDEHDIRHSLVEELRRKGFKSVCGLERAEDAVKETKKRRGTEHAFSFAVIDLKLESSATKYSTDPWRLPKDLKEIDSKIRLIAITAEYVGVDNQIHGIRHAKFDHWIDKLYQGAKPELIIEMIGRFLEKEELDGCLFEIKRKQEDDDGNVPSFTFDSYTRQLHEAEGKKAERRLVTSSKWLLEHFLRHPKLMIDKAEEPNKENVPGKDLPSPFTSNDDADLNQNLRTAIFNIRSAIAPDFIITIRDQGYCVNVHDWDVTTKPMTATPE